MDHLYRLTEMVAFTNSLHIVPTFQIEVVLVQTS